MAQDQRVGEGQARRSLWLLSGVPFLMVLGNSMLFPVFPKMQSAMGVGEMHTSLLVTAFSVPAGLFIPVAGYLSDRHGRRAIMAPGVALFGAGALVAFLAGALTRHPYPLLLAGRVIQGVGAAAMSQLAMAMAADLFPGSGRSRAMGLLESTNGLGKVISPVAGALLGMAAWFLPFLALAVLSLPLSLGLWLVAREPRHRPRARSLGGQMARVGRILRRRGTALASGLLAGMVLLFLLFGTLFYLSEILEKRDHLSQLAVGLVLAIPVGALSGVSYLSGRALASRPGAVRPAVLVGMAVAVAVMAVLAALRGRAALYAAIPFLGAGAGVALPALTLYVTSSAGAAQRGLVTSLYGGVRFLGVALGPPAFGWAMGLGPAVPFAGGGALAAAAWAAAFLRLRLPRASARPAPSSPRNQRQQAAVRRVLSPLHGRGRG